ncbi:MAG: cbb3-type cytochrome oxidase assembly protein CcoS [Gemmatimonadales bacterium]
MFPSSLAVILGGLLMGALALTAFLWAFRRGQFDDLEARAAAILDERDLRTERPWETPAQTAQRSIEHGPLVEPRAGDWGGAE